MSAPGKRSLYQKLASHRNSVTFLAFSALALALLSISGCTALTQAGSPAPKSPSGSNASPSLTISTQPKNETVALGQRATFTVVATGSGTLQYQWEKAGIAIGGATTATYSISEATAAENNAIFTVVVSEGTEVVTSSPATLTVVNSPASLSTNQASLNFSTVNLGGKKSLPVVFTNTGASEITISNVTVSGAGYTASGVQSGQILAAGATATLNVTFDPAATGALAGKVTVSSDATNSPSNIAMTGTGVQPPASHSATLSWTASTTAVTGYNVYRSTVSGGPYAKLGEAAVTQTESTDSAVAAGQTYYYVVTSVESSGIESAYSNEVIAVVPNGE
jgi:Protein of unknown function (DUF1573)